MNCDVVIIGGGPAGIGCLLRLYPTMKVVVVDQNSMPAGGLVNDGKMAFDKRIGMDLDLMPVTESDIKWVEALFEGIGEYIPRDEFREQYWQQQAEKFGVELVTYNQKHIGTDNAQDVIYHLRSLVHTVMPHVEWLLGKRAILVSRAGTSGNYRVDLANGPAIFAPRVIFATGRQGVEWTREQLVAFGVEIRSDNRVDIGFRVEMAAESYPITQDIYDPKFIFKGKDGTTRIRTFCTNPGGRIRTEKYDGYKLVNGDALSKKKTSNTNFALLYTVKLTEPFTDAVAYGRHYAEVANLLGGGKVLAQRFYDFAFKHRSTALEFQEEFRVKPTLQNFVAGDLRLCLPSKVADRLLDAMITLGRIVPGVAINTNILYAPEVKYRVVYPSTFGGEVQEGIYVAGDVCARSRSIVGAFVSGKLTGDEIAHQVCS